MRRYAFLVVLCVTILSCGDDNGPGGAVADVSDFLPGDGDVTGWVTEGSPREANDESSLYDIIDGGAAVYVEWGFQQGVEQSYTGTVAGASSEAVIRVFDQGTAWNADGVFQDERIAPPGAIPWSAAGDSARVRTDLFQDQGIDLRQDRYYVEVRVGNGGDRDIALEVAELFTIHVSEKIDRWG
jgi:hypothetical protein